MMRLSNICKYFGESLLFDQVNLDINEGEKVGVVGPNGCGKSTLLKIMGGLLDPDAGHINTSGNVSISYLPQHMDDLIDITVGNYLSQRWFDAQLNLRLIEEKMQDQSQVEWSSQLYTAAFEEFEKCGGYRMEEHLEHALSALNIPSIELTRRINTLSGGERTKLALARATVQPADLMLLDEPTNNLDRYGMEWLEQNLRQIDSACVIVSHDRTFLDRVTTRTLEIDQIRNRLTSYAGNYSWYKERKKQDEERQLRQFKDQQIKIKKLTEDIRAVKNQAMATEKTTQNDYLRGRSKKVAAKAKAREARLTRIIETEQIESPRFTKRPKFSLSGNAQYSSNLIEARDLSYAVDGKTVLSSVNFEIVGSSRTAITGCNGSGKSTLLKIIAGELRPVSGSIARKTGLRIGYLAQNQELVNADQSVLDHFKCLIETLQTKALNTASGIASDGDVSVSEIASKTASGIASDMESNKLKDDGEIRTLLHRFQFAKNDVFKNTNVLSRGERTKLILASFMACNLDLLIMDEPTNHLDLETIECFEEALNSYKGAFIIVSHDRYFLEKISPDRIWALQDKTLRNYVESTN